MIKKCDNCGNFYENSFQVIVNAQSYHFDCFECAIHKLAPRCHHCNTPVLGHGLEAESNIFCCAHCAREANVQGLTDHLAATSNENLKNIQRNSGF